MKRFLAIATILAALAAGAAVPLKWSCETSRATPATLDAYHGETVALSATMLSYGSPLDLTGKTAQLYTQTNGMGSAWWVTNATVTATNVLTATLAGSADPGAAALVGFIGIEGENYRAAFVVRYRNSPGFSPNALPLPTATIDCAAVTFLNPESAPWSGGGGGGGVSTNAVEALIVRYDETNLTARIDAKAAKNGSASESFAASSLSVATGGSVTVDGTETRTIYGLGGITLSVVDETNYELNFKPKSGNILVTQDATLDIDEKLGDIGDDIAAVQSALAGKQATISDLATIRTGAAAGATAAQPGDVASAVAAHNADSAAHSDIRTAVAAKVGSFEPVGGQTPTVASGVADLSPLFGSGNTSLRADNIRMTAADATTIKAYIDAKLGEIETALARILGGN